MSTKSNKYQYHRDGTLPRNGEVFVFGSNAIGVHGAGAAKAALQYGAVMGQGIGPVGNTYAIPTKDEHIQSLPLSRIRAYIGNFIKYAEANPDKPFFVTRVGCGLAKFTDAQIAPMFHCAPINCNFPEQWMEYLENSKLDPITF